MSSRNNVISVNIANIWQRINDAEHQFDRDAGSVSLLGVSKARTVDEIRAALGADLYAFGESYIQEAIPKIESLAGEAIEWHYIGRIQSNKARAIATHFDWVHTVPSLSVAGKLSLYRPEALPPLNVCLQVNISEEPGKSGASSESLLELAEEVDHLPRLRLRGLMVIPAKTKDEGEQRAAFGFASNLYRKLMNHGYSVDTLSMGMSGDFEAAIAEGATMIRIGTAIFGPRDTP